MIRYPKLSCPTELPQFSEPVEFGRGIFVPCSEFVIENISEKELESREHKVLVVCTGGIYSEVQKAIRAVLLEDGYADLYILRFIKPFDESYFIEIAKKYYGIVFVEDGIAEGGAGEYLNQLVLKNGITNTRVMGFEDRFYSHGTRDQVLSDAKLSVSDIKETILKCAK